MKQNPILPVSLLLTIAAWGAQSMLDAVFVGLPIGEAFLPIAFPQILLARLCSALFIVCSGMLATLLYWRAHRKLDAALGAEQTLCARLEDSRNLLARDNARLRALMEGALDWDFLLDASGKPLWISPAVEQLTGHTVEACRAMPDYPFSLIIPEDRPLAQEALDKGKNTPAEIGIRFLHREGSVGFGLLRCVPVSDSSAGLTGVRASVRDVTAEHAEADRRAVGFAEMLQESEQRFRLLNDHAPFAMLMFQGERLVYSNRMAGSLTGYSAVELASIDFWASLHPSCREQARATVMAISGGALASEQLELIIARQDGQECSVDARFSFLSWEGADAALVTLHDVTDRKAAEKALQESETRYRRLVESVTDYIYAVKIQGGRVLETKHGPGCVAVTGYTSAEYDENPLLWVAMVPEEDRSAVIAQADNILLGVEAEPLEHRLIHKDGRTIWVRNAPVPHYDEHGRLIGYDGMVSNITERRQAELGILEHARTLELLNKIILAANHAADLQSLLGNALEAALGLFQLDFGWVHILEPDSPEAELALALNVPPGFKNAMRRARLADPFYGHVLEKGQPVFSEGFAKSATQSATTWGMATVCGIPLVSKNRVIGAFSMAGREMRAFSDSERETLLAIGRQVGTAVEKIRSEDALRENEAMYRTITEHSLTGIFILANDRLVFANEGFAKILGFSLQQMLTWNGEQFLARIHPEDKAFVAEQNRQKLEADVGLPDARQAVFDCRLITIHGAVKWVLLHFRGIEFAGGMALAGVAVDITDRKLAEQAVAAANRQLLAREEQLRAVNEQLFGVIEQLKSSERELVAANAEKEILMKEIHHRVKNNLQVISSLLNLQSVHISDAGATALLKDCQARIKSMALVHEQLCQARNLARIDISEYISALVNHLFVMYGASATAIKLTLNTARVHLALDRAIPCSLIINELVSNSLKYGFPDGREGEIRVDLEAASKDTLRLVVADSGVGLPEHIDINNSNTLGLQLVMTFTEQLGGTITLDRTRGACFAIEFLATASD